MFTVEQRDALREHLRRLAEEDERVVAGAAVGSLAVNGGDRFSDLDLTFGIADHVPVADVLNDWTRTLIDELDAVHLADLERGPTTYRVFLLPDALQFDLSLTPAAQFRPAGPRFRLLFGETAEGESAVSAPPVAGDLFGWGVIYALHARACIERERVWQAEHYVGVVRDHALSLACLRQGLPAVQARGYDDLSAETLARFEAAHVGAVESGALRAALAVSVLALMREGAEARLPHADTLDQRLAELR
ncbi:MAG: nucleotidyltransferase domain-containing protein [Actinobacteria bacterium]|nr:nucleotidyltransferase domain-containing protein [Actinomycetota bacterium]